MFKHKFTSAQVCADRLYTQYTKHPQLIIAVDFDDTCHPYGEPFDTSEVYDLLKRAQAVGFQLVIYTASVASRFAFIEETVTKAGITIAGINKNLLLDMGTIGNSGKIYYNLLLCDRAGLGQAMETLEILLDKIEKETTTNDEQ